MCKALGFFSNSSTRFEEWLSTMLEIVRSRDSTRSETGDLNVIEDVINQREMKKEEFEEVIRLGKILLSKRDITDTSIVKDKLKMLEQQWKELGDILNDYHRKNKERMEQISAYEVLRAKVLEWLSSMEVKVDNLEPVALDKEVLRRQSLEIKVIAQLLLFNIIIFSICNFENMKIVFVLQMLFKFFTICISLINFSVCYAHI